MEKQFIWLTLVGFPGERSPSKMGLLLQKKNLIGNYLFFWAPQRRLAKMKVAELFHLRVYPFTINGNITHHNSFTNSYYNILNRTISQSVLTHKMFLINYYRMLKDSAPRISRSTPQNVTKTQNDVKKYCVAKCYKIVTFCIKCNAKVL